MFKLDPDVASPDTPGPFSECPDNITAIVGRGETKADVSWNFPSAETVTTSLPVGQHDFSYTLDNGSSCHFTVTITGIKNIQVSHISR